MAQPVESSKGGKSFSVATFLVGDALFGMDICQIQEINKITDFTQVPKAPAYVLGIINLRGRIVTVIDLGKKLGLPPTRHGPASRNIIVNWREESVGLFVDGIADVIGVEADKLMAPPSNLKGAQEKFLQGVYKTATQLITILDVETVLVVEDR